MIHKYVLLPVVAIAFGLGLSVEPDTSRWDSESGVMAHAEARVGRPLSPVSVGGVARRTTWRAVRRSTIYVVTLPTNCVTVTVNGTGYHQCGTTYYQPHQGQYVVVYID
jgi:hypothetical protein